MKSELNLELVLELPVHRLYFLSEDLLEGYYGSVRSDGGSYVYATGRSPICLVAHLDTCRNEEEPFELIKYKEFLYNKHGILGADDRAGVYMIFEILRECLYHNIPLPSVLLTNYEEVGMFGASEFVSHEHFVSSGEICYTKLFIGLDRCGSYKYVTYEQQLPQYITDYVNQFGFQFSTSRKQSDVKILSDAYGVPTVNLSIGYTAEHTRNERLNMMVYQDTRHRVLGMVANPPVAPPNVKMRRKV